MTVSALALAAVIGTSLGWSVLDLLRKLLVRTLSPVALLFLLTLAQSLLFAVWVWLDAEARLGPGYWLPALGSVALNVVANVAFIQALSLAPLSLTIPLLSLTPALATLVSVVLVGELPSAPQILGILLVVVGALILHLDEGWRSLSALGRALGRNRGSQLMLLVAVMWSTAIPLDKLAVGASSSSVHALGLSLGVALGSLAILLVRGRLGEVRAVVRVPGLFLASLAVSAVSLALLLVALTVAWVSFVETLKRVIGNLLSVAFGRWFFGEAVTVQKLAAVTLMIAGVVLVSM